MAIHYLGGQALRRAREGKRWTRRDLLARLRRAGMKVSPRTIVHWEADKYRPDPCQLSTLANVLELSLADLFSGNGK